MYFKKIFLACFVAIILVVVIYYFNKPAEQSMLTLEKISCRLKWYIQSQFAGNLVAVSEDYYRNAGLDCTLVPGGQDFNAIKLVASGENDFGVWGADQILIARSKGIPVVAIAVIYQKSPVCFFSKKNSGIIKPCDFVGKKVAMQYGTNVRTEYVAMMNNVKVDLNKVIEVPSRYDMQRFFEGAVDVWCGYVINEVLTAEEKGFEVNLIKPSDYGVKMYADCLFTTEEMIKNRPEIVRRFVQATLQGWQFAIKHPAKAVEIVLSHDAKLRKEHELRMLLKSIPFILPGSGKADRIGEMDSMVWKEMEKTLFKQHIIKHRVDVSLAFNNHFLPFH